MNIKYLATLTDFYDNHIGDFQLLTPDGMEAALRRTDDPWVYGVNSQGMRWGVHKSQIKSWVITPFVPTPPTPPPPPLDPKKETGDDAPPNKPKKTEPPENAGTERKPTSGEPRPEPLEKS